MIKKLRSKGISAAVGALVLAGMRGVPRFAVVHGYVDCVMAAGGLPLIFPNVDPATTQSYLARVDGLILSGGLDVDTSTSAQSRIPSSGRSTSGATASLGVASSSRWQVKRRGDSFSDRSEATGAGVSPVA